jgi:hypothetical protein
MSGASDTTETRRAAARRTALALGLVAAGFFVSAFFYLVR